MHILGPNLATAFTIALTGLMMSRMSSKAIRIVQERKDFSLLEILHHLTCGIRAFASDAQYKGMDEMRSSCGGAGTLMASGVANWWSDAAMMPVIEGTTTLMYQQSARFLFKNLLDLGKDNHLSGVFSYLNDMQMLIGSKCTAKTVDEFTTLNSLARTLATRAAFHIIET
jgi:acyl-CoA oxidase